MSDQQATGEPRWNGIDHVQLAIPIGAEDEARRFYPGVLGLEELPGTERCHVDDPFGNRIELIEAGPVSR